MYQATTPTFKFTIPYEETDVTDMLLTFMQGKVGLDFGLSDVTFDGKTVMLTLTQEQTSQFTNASDAQVQMRLKLTDGTVVASQIIRFTPKKSLNLEVL